jgi:hypothetical protein
MLITLADMDVLAAFGILAGLAVLLVWTSRRWGPPGSTFVVPLPSGLWLRSLP